MAPNPDRFRDLEDAVVRWLHELGYECWPTGQEHVDSKLGRWSPDFWSNAGFWVDAKIRNRDYPFFLVEWDEIVRHTKDFSPTIYVLVARDPIEICGWISAHAARWLCGHQRNDHQGNGSGDVYVQIHHAHLRTDANFVVPAAPVAEPLAK